jgi:hypothetical protein
VLVLQLLVVKIAQHMLQLQLLVMMGLVVMLLVHRL